MIWPKAPNPPEVLTTLLLYGIHQFLVGEGPFFSYLRPGGGTTSTKPLNISSMVDDRMGPGDACLTLLALAVPPVIG